MGMYTELHFNVELKKDTPDEIIKVLQYMLYEEGAGPEGIMHVSDPLFGPDSRWRFMLRSDSYYFSADTHSTLRYDDIGQAYYLCIRCNLKNYDGEIDKFVDWIIPHVLAYSGDFLGFSRYEGSKYPVLIRYPEEGEFS